MDEVLAADRAKLALGEEAGDRDRAGLGADDARVVVRLGEQVRAPAVAGEQERRGRRFLVGGQVKLQQGVQVLVGGVGVADVELDIWPTRTRSPTASAPLSRMRPRTLRTRKSPRRKSPWYSLMTRPMCSPC